MKPYKVSFKFNPKQNVTDILVDDVYYDKVNDYISYSEQADWEYTILKHLYNKEAQKELTALRRENQHLKQIISVYQDLETIEDKYNFE